MIRQFFTTTGGIVAETLFECNEPSCTLGARGEPGHFTGGITAEGVNLLTGTPVESLTEGEDFGEGICPNCGTKGTEVGTHESVEGEDPYANLHAQASNQDEFLAAVAAQETTTTDATIGGDQ